MPQAQAQQVVSALPFTASAHEYTEVVSTITVPITATAQDLDPIQIKPYGYLRHLWIGVSCAGGAGSPVISNGDYPWSLIRTLTLQDTNGGNIFGPCTGYSTYLANLFGGYAFMNDPASAPFHDPSASNPVFFMRVPLEISARDGFGAWPNQNAAANLSLSMGIAASGTQWSTPPSTLPTLTITVIMECWTIPAAADAKNRPQAQTPPLMGTGQFWTSSRRTINVGDNDPQVTRTGSYIRNLICIYRDVNGARADAVAPTTLRFMWDGVQFHKMTQKYAKNYAREKLNGRLGNGQDNQLPNGVYAFSFAHGLTGRDGNETPDLWLPTKQSANVRVEGTSASAGTLEFLVNDVAPFEVNQAEKYQVPNETGALVNPTA